MPEAMIVVDPRSEVQKLNDKIMANLAELGGRRAEAEEVTYGRGFQVPDMYRGKLNEAAKRLNQIHKEQEEYQLYIHDLPYKSWDVSVAIVRVFKEVFGVSVVQRSTFFQPSGFRDIPVSPTQKVKAPIGEIVLLTFDGTLNVNTHTDQDGYPVARVVVNCPKKFENQVNGLFAFIEQDLAKNSIYKGKAIDGADMPDFLDLSKIDIEKIIYARITMRQLQANLWAPIEYPEVCRARGLDPKRAVLLQGPYGTGKTLGAMWTAKLCEENDRTFVMCNPKDNNAFECLRTAALYQPACLFVEDIDKLASTEDREAMSRLLDEFDGLKAKGRDIVIVLTTNRVGEIHKGMLRPGRMDAVIEIANLDLEGTTALIRSIFTDDELDPNLNFKEIHDAMEGFTPAFSKEVAQKVKLYSIARVGAGQSERYTTEDFIAASEEMRVHFLLHTGAGELKQPPTIDEAIRRSSLKAAQDVLHHLPIHETGDPSPVFEALVPELVKAEKNGQRTKARH